MSHRPTFANHIEKSWAHSFRDNRIDGICPENTCQQLCILSMSLPHNKALPKLFPTVSSLPTELSPSNFPRLPFRSCCRRFRLTPFQQSSPRAISHGFFSVHDVVASVSLPPNEVSPSYFPRLPFRSWCRRFSLAPSQRSLPKLFPTVSFPFMMSSLPSRSLPTDLSPSYFPRFPFRSWYRRFRLAPSQRSSPQANSHGFLSVHDVVPSVSLHPRQSKLNENPSIGDTFGKKKTSNRWRPSFSLKLRAGCISLAAIPLLRESSMSCWRVKASSADEAFANSALGSSWRLPWHNQDKRSCLAAWHVISRRICQKNDARAGRQNESCCKVSPKSGKVLLAK